LLTAESWTSIGAAGATRLVEQCSTHGLLPLLFAATDVPPAVEHARAAAKGWQRILEVRARRFSETVSTVCHCLAGEPVMLIKGSDYAQRLYPRPLLRPMQDIDILVPAGRIDAVCARLLAAGLTAQPTFGVRKDPGYIERVFFHSRILVEVHPAFIQRERHRIGYEGLWHRAVPLEVGGQRVLRLEDVDALAHHALSMAIDHFNTRIVRYVDLWLLLQQRPDVAVAAAARAREWHTARALYGALSLACRICPDFATKDVRAAMEAAVSAPTRSMLERMVLPGMTEVPRLARPRRVVELWRKAWLMDTAGHAVSFALAHALATWRYRQRTPA
jgi:hypothetical protein